MTKKKSTSNFTGDKKTPRGTKPSHVKQPLRKQAEARLAKSPNFSKFPPAVEARRMLHELQVHQIELEMQNEELRRAQSDIEAGRARYFELYEMAPVGYCTLSEKGLILEANLKASTLLGTVRSKLIQKPLSHHIVKEDQERYHLHCRNLFETRKAQEFELQLVKPDGTTLWVHLTATAARAEDGTPLCRVALSDFTEHKRAEESLRELQRFFQSTLDGLSAHITVLNDRGEIIFTNKAYRDFAEKNEGDPCTVSEGVNYLAVCDTAQGEEKEQAGLFAQGIREILSGKRPSFELEYPCHSPDQQRWFIGRVTPIQDKGCRRAVVAHENITERKLAVETLKASNTRFKELLQNVGTVAVQGYALDGTVRYWNHASETFYGYTADEALSKNLLELVIPPSLRDEVRAAIRQMAATHEPIPPSEIELMRKDGSSIFVYSSHVLVQLPGQEPEMFCIDIDLTELKKTEAEREKLQAQFLEAQKMESVGRLAGGVAHDFNNLLMGILGYTELCRTNLGVGHPIAQWLDEITKGAQRSANLTRQLLAFARKQTITPQFLDTNDAVAGMLNLLRQLLGEDITLAWAPGTDVWPIKMDPGQIDQILANLSVNARDAIKGVGQLTVGTTNAVIDLEDCLKYPEAVPGEYAVLIVSDNGCGMNPETLAHIFEPFFTTKEVGRGTGLGLATVYGIVKQNGGFVSVHSEPGKGTAFKIYLPRCQKSAEKIPVAEVPATAPRGTETILLVDDEKSICMTLSLLLELQGFKVLPAADPREALLLASQHPGPIHLLITDVIMPGMNGRDLAAKLTQKNPRLKCLFISGYTADVIAQHGIVEEGIHFLAKPFSSDVITKKVFEVLKGESQAR